jgi:predicted AAA+ superfamily ATPase
MGTPMAGHSWENFVVTQLLPLIRKNWNIWFYRTHTGVEADLVLGKGLNPEICIEIKLSSAPSLSSGFVTAIKDLGTARNFVIIPEAQKYRLRKDITVYGLKGFLEIADSL